MLGRKEVVGEQMPRKDLSSSLTLWMLAGQSFKVGSSSKHPLKSLLVQCQTQSNIRTNNCSSI